MTFCTVLLYDSEVCLPFNKGNELKKKSEVKSRIIKVERQQILRLSVKKKQFNHQDAYKSLSTVIDS